MWLISRSISPDTDNQDLKIGRLIHTNTFEDEKMKEYTFDFGKIDMITNSKNETKAIEIKKSTSQLEASKWQLLYYLYNLKKLGVEIEGEIRIPLKKKKFKVELTPEKEKIIEKTIEDIGEIIESGIPEIPNHEKLCKNCGHNIYCQRRQN